jgi:hypothetical protein
LKRVPSRLQDGNKEAGLSQAESALAAGCRTTAQGQEQQQYNYSSPLMDSIAEVLAVNDGGLPCGFDMVVWADVGGCLHKHSRSRILYHPSTGAALLQSSLQQPHTRCISPTTL